MKKTKKILVIFCAILMIAGSVGIMALAAANSESSSAADSSSSDVSAAPKDKGPRGSRGQKDGTHVDVLSVAASVLGKTVDEVKEAVKDGKVGDLLIAANKVEAFKEAYLAQAKSKLDAAVAAGTLTQEEADVKYAKAEEKMTAYDGTQHLCGGKDHSKMFEKRNRQESPSETNSADAAL